MIDIINNISLALLPNMPYQYSTPYLHIKKAFHIRIEYKSFFLKFFFFMNDHKRFSTMLTNKLFIQHMFKILLTKQINYTNKTWYKAFWQMMKEHEYQVKREPLHHVRHHDARFPLWYNRSLQHKSKTTAQTSTPLSLDSVPFVTS